VFIGTVLFIFIVEIPSQIGNVMTQHKIATSTINRYLVVALLLGLLIHGSAMFFTLEKTYDALIHVFFGNHYAMSWFEPWNPKWYTGFSVMGYPPLVHQSIALLSLLGGLKFGLYTIALIGVFLFTTGVYRYALLLSSNQKIAGYAALFAVVSSSFAEALHVFGQLPSIIGVSVLMHALPYIYNWIRLGHKTELFKSLSLLAATVASHHVTPIFGMVFFIFPVIGMAILDQAQIQLGKEATIRFKHFLKTFKVLFWRIIGFGSCSLILIIGVILPYWINSRNNPISQVPIPHGSRDSYIETLSSGFIFFLIPYGVLLFIIPYFFYRFFSKRYIFFGISLSTLFILGTGGTTPIPKTLLGETAFNILTLDRFTLWATIIVLPLVGEFIYRLIEGDIRAYLFVKYGKVYAFMTRSLYVGVASFLLILTLILFQFRPSQPTPIKMQPLLNFLSEDDHDRWRYLTLGFGDQMAWLSAETNALTVDGNYHSARRLPELTTRAVERLENSKFLGIEGLGSLQQFLTVPHKYNLRYVFSNDKFYDPILHFAGWKRLTTLENGVHVWERLSVAPLPVVLPKDEVAKWQKIHWGTVPISTLLIAVIWTILIPLIKRQERQSDDPILYWSKPLNQSTNLSVLHAWSYLLGLTCIIVLGTSMYYSRSQISPQNTLKAYYSHLDFKEFGAAYELIDKTDAPSMADYLLAVSVSDGVLNSYAKLNSIDVEVQEQSADYAIAEVTCEYITPLKVVYLSQQHTLKKHENKWYLGYEPIDRDLPPQLYKSQPKLDYHDHGRKRISSGKTYRDDIIIQPIVACHEASLTQVNDTYSIIGTIKNTDNRPADVTITATLYNRNNEPLATYSTMYIQKHVLLPQEYSHFRLEFEDTAWLNPTDHKPSTFNPELSVTKELADIPHHFDIHISTVTTDVTPYHSVALTEIKTSPEQITGMLFNAGNQEVTIPQLLVGYYDQSQKLVWVDHQFLQSNVRQQRKVAFDYSLVNLSEINVMAERSELIYCNGRKQVSELTGHTPPYVPIDADLKLSLDVNNFIGNPK